MSAWTPDSLRPPTLEDGPFYASDFGLVGAADAYTGPLPVRTEYFVVIAEKVPLLDDELVRLCRSHPDEGLAALADALRATVKGHIGRGRPKKIETGRSSFHFTPVTTKAFEAAVAKYPGLREDLRHLCDALPGGVLGALSDALRVTVKGRVGRGRRTLAGLGGVPAPVRAAVQSRKLRGLPDAQIACEIEHMLPPGQATNAPMAKSSLRKRAQRIVAAISFSRSGLRISHALALSFWAIGRAGRQLEAAIRRGVLTEEEAIRRLEERNSRFMSRAVGRARA